MYTLVLGGSPVTRRRFAERVLLMGGNATLVPSPASLPFVSCPRTPAANRALLAEIHTAFPDGQRSGPRLVLTQSTYVLQTWIDRIPGPIVATADRKALEYSVPEALLRRGPWRLFHPIDLDAAPAGGYAAGSDAASTPAPAESSEADSPVAGRLARAFHTRDARERAVLCADASADEPESAVARLALASALREAGDQSRARTALDAALRLAPEWEAVHFEDGKFWLACDALDRAHDAFSRACHLMPSFSAAWSNLGATLGELGRPEDALAAFERALDTDPSSVSLLSNIGVVNRELGRLDTSETALRRAIDTDAHFIFGHYNLGHTLFLQRRFDESVTAYEEGQRRDPQRNTRQACRLAIARFAARDVAGAGQAIAAAMQAAAPEEREDLLLEAYEIASVVNAPDEGSDEQRAFLKSLVEAIREAGAF